MNQQSDPQNTHIYKLKRWRLALQVLNLLFLVIVMPAPLAAVALAFFSIKQSNTIPAGIVLVFGCIAFPLIILTTLIILQAILTTVMLFFVYIKVTPDGIEQKNSPYMHIRSSWADIEKIGKLYLFYDVLYLHAFETLGLSISLKAPFRFLRPRPGIITLSGFDGWPDGQLAADLKGYIPGAFEGLPELAGASQDNLKSQPAVALSQENRVLASIAHASIMISNMGIVLPIAIYALQKDRKNFTGFQALQAIVWQGTAFSFNALISIIMIGAIFIPGLLAELSQNKSGPVFVNNGPLIVFLIALSLLIIINIFFSLYALVGAVMTLQGKEFRYIIIGNRIKRTV